MNHFHFSKNKEHLKKNPDYSLSFFKILQKNWIWCRNWNTLNTDIWSCIGIYLLRSVEGLPSYTFAVVTDLSINIRLMYKNTEMFLFVSFSLFFFCSFCLYFSFLFVFFSLVLCSFLFQFCWINFVITPFLLTNGGSLWLHTKQ